MPLKIYYIYRMKWTGVTSRVSSGYLIEKVAIFLRQLIQTRTGQKSLKMKFSLLFISALAFNEDLNPSKEVNLVNLIWKYYQKDYPWNIKQTSRWDMIRKFRSPNHNNPNDIKLAMQAIDYLYNNFGDNSNVLEWKK